MGSMYWSRDGKTRAKVVGTTDSGDTLFAVYYNGDGWPRYECHRVRYYDWASRPHGNAPGGTPYGYFRATGNGKRVILTV